MLVVHARYMSCICHLILAIGWILILYIFTWTLHVVWYGFLEVQWLGPKSKQPMQTWWMWRFLYDLASFLLCQLWKPTKRILPTSKQKRHTFYPFIGGMARSWHKRRMRWGHRYNNLWTTTHQRQLFLFHYSWLGSSQPASLLARESGCFGPILGPNSVNEKHILLMK